MITCLTFEQPNDLFQDLLDSEQRNFKQNPKIYSRLSKKLSKDGFNRFPDNPKTQFKKLFWFDAENDVVRAVKSPSETNRCSIDNVSPVTHEFKSSSNQILGPRRRLLFKNKEGKMATNCATYSISRQ